MPTSRHIIALLLAIFVAIALGHIKACATTAATQGRPGIPDSLESTQTSERGFLFQLKRDLLLAELQQRAEGIGTAQSMLAQARLALLTIIVAVFALVFENRRKNGFQAPSKLIAWTLLILLFCLYWSDSFMCDLSERGDSRLNEVNTTLSTLHTLSADSIARIKTFPSLRRSDIVHKVALLWRPNFAQVLAYLPIAIFTVVLFYSAYSRKR
jgi:hypothetical protein